MLIVRTPLIPVLITSMLFWYTKKILFNLKGWRCLLREQKWRWLVEQCPTYIVATVTSWRSKEGFYLFFFFFNLRFINYLSGPIRNKGKNLIGSLSPFSFSFSWSFICCPPSIIVVWALPSYNCRTVGFRGRRSVDANSPMTKPYALPTGCMVQWSRDNLRPFSCKLRRVFWWILAVLSSTLHGLQHHIHNSQWLSTFFDEFSLSIRGFSGFFWPNGSDSWGKDLGFLTHTSWSSIWHIYYMGFVTVKNTMVWYGPHCWHAVPDTAQWLRITN